MGTNLPGSVYAPATTLMAVTSFWLSIIPAAGVIFGGVITGTFALLTQQRTRTAELQRWEREASERRSTRFQETRLAIYSEFVEAAASAGGYALQAAIRDHSDLPDGTLPATVPKLRALKLSPNATDVNEDALRKMTQLQNKVAMLAGTPDVREAAKELTEKVIMIMLVPRDHVEWNAAVAGAHDTYQSALARFLDLAHRELTY